MLQFKKFLISVILSFSVILSSLPVYQASASSLNFLILSQYKATLDIGDELFLYAFTSNGKPVRWKSSDTKTASVNTYGVVTARKSGNAVITAKMTNAEASCHITVRKTKVTISKTHVIMERGETYKLSATTSNASTVCWKSNKKSIATVDENGVITAQKPGETIIHATADQSEAICTITVKSPSVKLSRSSVNLYRGQSIRLSAFVSSHIPPTWKVNKKSIATIDSYGTVTAMKNGTATITATVDGITDSCLLIVMKPKITLSVKELTLKEGESKGITAVISSGNSPVWTTSNQNIAVVDSNGTITAKQKGKAFVYATEDGTKARCTVYITD